MFLFMKFINLENDIFSGKPCIYQLTWLTSNLSPPPSIKLGSSTNSWGLFHSIPYCLSENQRDPSSGGNSSSTNNSPRSRHPALKAIVSCHFPDWWLVNWFQSQAFIKYSTCANATIEANKVCGILFCILSLLHHRKDGQHLKFTSLQVLV